MDTEEAHEIVQMQPHHFLFVHDLALGVVGPTGGNWRLAFA
jgi:hypothetical protein